MSALVGLALATSGCRPKSASDAPGTGWSPLVAAPDTVLLDTAGVEWTSSDARVWLRTPHPGPIAPGESTPRRVVAVETRHDVSCDRREVRDLEIRAVGLAGDIVGDSVVQPPSWIPAARHPALQRLLPALCERLSLLNPRGLHTLLGSDRP
jgi:hypothetical protein